MITLDAIIFSLPNSMGGVSVYFAQLAQQLGLSLADLAVWIYGNPAAAQQLRCRPEQVVPRRQRLLERFRDLDGVRPGLLHSSYYRTSTQRGVANVVTVYDFTYEKFVSGPRALPHKLQKRRAIMRADAVICISENTRRDLLQLLPHYPEQRLFVTHLAAGEVFRPLQQATVTITARPFVLFVGGRGGYKNFAAAIQGVQRVRECSIVCVGGGPFDESERATLEGALPGRYFHAGAVSAEELNGLYNAAVCLLYPSLYEGFGIPPLEAMQAGCPFVALSHSSIPEVAGRAGVLLETSDPQLIADAIERCAGAQRRGELRELGFEQARRFSWRTTCEQTAAIYARLLP
ncbi:MAG TPA: glycosyltransferase family 1 protein [Steroidobacteraceae bacterium]|nr:glycosyltransferase family 1 protein [Steroidobacteraceae bacterium]